MFSVLNLFLYCTCSFFFSSRRRHTRSYGDWSSDVCSSDLRYANGAALADDLRRFGEGRPIQARPVGWGERSWRWGRRNPTAAALLITAVALVGLAIGGGV